MNLDDYFKTQHADYKLITKYNSDNDLILVKGDDLYKDCSININKTVFVQFYQISIFLTEQKHSIRVYYLKGITGNGACFYDYQISKIKDYKISDSDLKKFIKFLDKKIIESHTEKLNTKYKYLYYPVYNFIDTSPPTGNEINECVTELTY
jgi:hypothetical protein